MLDNNRQWNKKQKKREKGFSISAVDKKRKNAWTLTYLTWGAVGDPSAAGFGLDSRIRNEFEGKTARKRSTESIRWKILLFYIIYRISSYYSICQLESLKRDHVTHELFYYCNLFLIRWSSNFVVIFSK